jgi:preprotein translocase subunit SecE
VNEYIKLAIWVAVAGGIFAYIWRKGHLARLSKYVLETREELRKCSWPTIDELKGSTVVVLVAMVLLSGFTIAVDTVFSAIIRLML